MRLLLIGVGGLLIGFGLGWCAAGWVRRKIERDARSRTRALEAPVGEQDYLTRWHRLHDAYTGSIKEYDRLVTWASGGALFLSVTLLDKLRPTFTAGSRWWLAAGWIWLACSLLSSLWSQYASSRVHSWRLRELDHLQQAVEQRDEVWTAEFSRQDRSIGFWATSTKFLTFISGVLLVGGLMWLAVFAYLNARFDDRPATAPVASATALRTTELKMERPTEPVTEKKGTEDFQPIRRPASTSTTTTTRPSTPPTTDPKTGGTDK